MPEKSVINVKFIMWYLFAGTKGSEMRIKIINLLRERPYNKNQLTKLLKVDYNTIKYHLKILSDNKFIISSDNRYGRMFHISQMFESNINTFHEIFNKLAIKDKKSERKV